MPNFREIQEAIKDGCKSPLVMVALSRGEVAAKRTELQAFTDGAGYFMVSNLPKLHSLFGGSLLSPVENASKKELAGEEFQSLDELVTMKSNPLDGTDVPQLIGVDADLAFVLAGEEINCPITGRLTKMEYHGEIAVDGESGQEALGKTDDEEDEEEISDVDLSDSEGNSDDSSEDDMSSDPSSDDEDSDNVEDDTSDDEIEEEVDEGDLKDDEEDENMELSNDDSPFTIAGTETKSLLDKYEGAVTVYEEDGGEPSLYGAVVRVLSEDTFVVIDEDGNPYTVKATTVGDDGDAVKLVGSLQSADTASEQEVDAADTVDLGENQVKLVSLTGKDNSEVAVFVGQMQIATLIRSRAAEVAAPLFNDGQKLMAAFKPTLKTHYGNSKAPELAKFGYVPVVFKMKTHKLFDQRLQREVAKLTATSETAAATKVQDFTSNLELAFVGINKGFFKDVKNELALEIAGMLKRAGVAGAELEVRKLLAKHSKSYVKTAMEQAKVLNTKSADYLNGISEALAKSDFNVSETASVHDISTAFHQDAPKVAQPEIAGFDDTPKPTGNRFASVIAGLRR